MPVFQNVRLSTHVPSDTLQPVQPVQHCIPTCCGSPLASWRPTASTYPSITSDHPGKLSGSYFGLHYCPKDHPVMAPENAEHPWDLHYSYRANTQMPSMQMVWNMLNPPTKVKGWLTHRDTATSPGISGSMNSHSHIPLYQQCEMEHNRRSFIPTLTVKYATLEEVFPALQHSNKDINSHKITRNK